MKRTAINPSSWSQKFGFHQGEVIEGATRYLTCSGQSAMDDQGVAQHIGDLRGQFQMAMDNLKSVLDAANMSVSDIVRLKIYTTDMQQTIKNFDVLGAAIGGAGVKPPLTVCGVTGFADPSLMIEIEADAAQ